MNYSAYFLARAKNSRHVGKLRGATHKGCLVNEACGDGVVVYLKVKNFRLEAMKHQTEGCLVAKFAASVLSEKLPGKGIEDILKITPQDLTKLLGMSFTMNRLRCALLPLLAVQEALRDKNPQHKTA